MGAALKIRYRGDATLGFENKVRQSVLINFIWFLVVGSFGRRLRVFLRW